MCFDYEKKLREALAENVKDVLRAVKAGELDTTINSFCEMHDLSRDDVINEINNNEMFSRCFAINPKTQNFYEKEAANILEEIECIVEFKHFITKKPFLGNGKINYASRKNPSPRKKLIDFKWECKNKIFYVTHKYTKNSGGTQDKAYEDIQLFIKQANDAKLRNTYFIAIADGDYYKIIIKGTNTTKIDVLKDLANRNNVFACTIDEVENLMKKICC